MIKIRRPPFTSFPELYRWANISARGTRDLVAEFAARGKVDGFKPIIWQRTRDALAEIFHFKCAACESLVGVSTSVDVTHFRPLRRVVEVKSSQGYWWLAYDWSNLFILCPNCEHMKGHRFPIAGKRALSPSDKLSREKPFLLDPCVDDPNDHLAFDDNGTVVRQTDRGRVTIEIYGLNRETLVEARRQAIETKLLRMRWTIAEMRRGQDALDAFTVLNDMEYAAALRAAVHRFVLAQERAVEYSAEGRKLVSRAKKAKPINHEQIERLASEAAQKEVSIRSRARRTPTARPSLRRSVASSASRSGISSRSRRSRSSFPFLSARTRLG